MSGIVSLCTGYGALDSAVTEVTGAELIAVADTDKASAKLLAHHYPDVPNVGDIVAADWSRFASPDWVTAGWPCQPWSVGGLMKGALDERAIWPAVARAVRDLRPRFVLLENVPAIASAGELARAVGDLAALGYVGSWRCVSAASVGAAHLRERIFIVAADANRDELREQPVSQRGRRRKTVARHPGQAVPDTAGIGHDWRRRARDGRNGPANSRGIAGEPWTGSWTGPNGDDYGPAIRQWERVIGRHAPGPAVLGPKGGSVLSPYFTEWLMGVDEGWITSVPGLSRAEMVKLAGNGVVKQAAVQALRECLPLLEQVQVAA